MALIVLLVSVGGGISPLAGEHPAMADISTMPALVEDYSYPNAEEVLARLGIKLRSGDGNFVLVDCPLGLDVNDDLIRIGAYSLTDRACFKIHGPVGYIALEIPRVYQVETNHDHVIDVTLQRLADGATQRMTLQVDDGDCEWSPHEPSCWNPVGEGMPAGTANAAALLEMRARPVSGFEPAILPAPTADAAVGRLVAGLPGRSGSRACTATLVAPSWVVSAASCFGDPAGLTSGPPPMPATVRFGGRSPRHVVHLVPRGDRDLVLAKLDIPQSGIVPSALAMGSAASGAPVQIVSLGRSEAEWIPSHAGVVSATVAEQASATLALTADGSVCRGAAGAPVKSAAGALIALVTTAGQQGCMGASGTSADVGAARTDDIRAWIAGVTQSSAPNGDHRGEVLASGDSLHRNQYLASANLLYSLVFQSDGNLVLYNGSQALWQSGTNGQGGSRVVMQSDGNLVMYRADNTAVWNSSTMGHPGSYLHLQSDGNLHVRNQGTAFWSTNTGGRDSRIYSGLSHLARGGSLGVNQYLRSLDGRHALLLQPDGNLVLYSRGYHVLWHSGTVGSGADRLVMQDDGNLVLYAGTTPLWQTMTNGSGADRAVLQDDANFVVYTANTARWQSGTSGRI